MTVVVMPTMSVGQEQAWHALMDLHDLLPTDWSLVGGQMVHLHCAERGGAPIRPTDDADTVVDVRAHPDILLTEGAGPVAEQRRGVQGAPTIAAPGTTRALARSAEVQVEVAGRVGAVRRPNLVGAIVGKAAARVDLGSGAASGRHCADFVVLASLIAASDFRNEDLSKKDRQRLRRMVAICASDSTALSVENAQEHLDRLTLAAAL